MDDLSPLKIDRDRALHAPRRRKGSGRWVYVVPLLLVAAGLWYFRKPIMSFGDRLRLPEVQVTRATKSTLLSASTASGTAANGYVVASVRAALSADTPGRIVELNVKEGTVMRKGDIVARLFADEYRAALEHAQADVKVQEQSVILARSELAVAQAEVERQRAGVTAAEAAVEEGRATFDQTKLKLDRAELMVGGDVVSREWLDDARADHARAIATLASSQALLNAAEKGVRQAERRVESAGFAVGEAEARIPSLVALRDQAAATLDKTNVRAPFDGIVVLKDAEVGEVVSPNSQGGNSRGSVATMVDLSSLEVQVELPERNLDSVVVGAPVKIFLDAWPDEPYTGSVQRIWPVANRQKATVEVRASFDHIDARLRPEMGARVVFLTGAASPEEKAPPVPEGAPVPPALAPEGAIVPATAIVTIFGASGLFVVERDTVHFVAVEAGGEKSGRVLVRKGLVGGERVVVEPPATLEDGDRVRAKD